MTLSASAKAIIIREARKDWADIQRTVADWNEMADQCQREGYAPRYCIHGTDRWTDYDNICGGCEDGIFPQDMTYMEVLSNTLAQYRRVRERVQNNRHQLSTMSTSMRNMGLSDKLISETIMGAIDEMYGRFA